MHAHLRTFTGCSMTYPIVLSVVAAEALALLLLCIALRVSMPRLARPLVACCGLSGAWGAWVLAVLRGSASMIALTSVVFAVGSVATAIAIHFATCDAEEHEDGGAGRALRPDPEAPRGGGGDDEPLWWPEFERQLTAYSAERERERPAVTG
jgi:hypothetical protein